LREPCPKGGRGVIDTFTLIVTPLINFERVRISSKSIDKPEMVVEPRSCNESLKIA